MKKGELMSHELRQKLSAAHLIESLLQPGMTWDNYGEWHVDHKHPVSAFLRAGISDPAIINALANMQPLWKADNQRKHAKVAV